MTHVLMAGKRTGKPWKFNFSYSAISLGSCEVAFWFRYVVGQTSLGNDATQTGSTFTFLAEALTKGWSKETILQKIKPDILEFYKQNEHLISSLIDVAVHSKLIPINDPDWVAEPKFYFNEDGLPFTAGFDLLNVSKLIIGDYKVRKDTKYMPDSTEIIEDMQLNIYGYTLARELDLADHEKITVGHRNLFKSNFFFQVVEGKKTVAEFKEYFHSIVLPQAHSLVKVLDADSQDDLRPNFNNCEKFRGCEFAARCKHNLARTASGKVRVSR
jgi:hypothetical protein